jgi:hypothetical protein
MLITVLVRAEAAPRKLAAKVQPIERIQADLGGRPWTRSCN